MSRRPVTAVALILGIVSACSSGAAASLSPSSPGTAQPTDLTVYAAASLRDALDEVKTAYQGAFPGTTLTIGTDSSSALRTQIEQGAPADLFLSADRQNPQTLVDAGLTDGKAVDFAGNLLTIVVPTDDRAGISSPADLAKPGVKIVAAGDEVPVTWYANQAVANLAMLAGYPASFAEAYAANIVSKEENVRAVVAKIELGEGDAAIVYVTDGKASSRVKTVEIPAAANAPATYAGVVVKGSPNTQAAHTFLDWLAGPNGAAVLAAFGFLPPP